MDNFNFAQHALNKKNITTETLNGYNSTSVLTAEDSTLQPYTAEQLQEWQSSNITKDIRHTATNEQNHRELSKELQQSILSQQLPSINEHWYKDNFLVPPTAPTASIGASGTDSEARERYDLAFFKALYFNTIGSNSADELARALTCQSTHCEDTDDNGANSGDNNQRLTVQQLTTAIKNVRNTDPLVRIKVQRTREERYNYLLPLVCEQSVNGEVLFQKIFATCTHPIIKQEVFERSVGKYQTVVDCDNDNVAASYFESKLPNKVNEFDKESFKINFYNLILPCIWRCPHTDPSNCMDIFLDNFLGVTPNYAPHFINLLQPVTTQKNVKTMFSTLKSLRDMPLYALSEKENDDDLNKIYSMWRIVFSYCEFINFINMSFRTNSKFKPPFILQNAISVDVESSGEAMLLPHTIYLFRGLFYTISQIDSKSTLLKATNLKDLVFTSLYRQINED